MDGVHELFRCRWENRVSAEADGGGADVAQRVLPDNCADFIVSSSGRAWLVGPPTRFELPALAAGTVLHGLRIKTAAIRAVTGTDATDLTDRTVAIDDLLSSRRARLLTEALASGVVTAALLRSLWPGVAVSPAARAGVAALAGDSRASVGAVADDVAFSSRHFRRLIQQETGLAPKTIQRVGRIQRVLSLARARDERLGMLAHGAGFADQAHLSRVARSLTGLTPRQLIARHGA